MWCRFFFFQNEKDVLIIFLSFLLIILFNIFRPFKQLFSIRNMDIDCRYHIFICTSNKCRLIVSDRCLCIEMQEEKKKKEKKKKKKKEEKKRNKKKGRKKKEEKTMSGYIYTYVHLHFNFF